MMAPSGTREDRCRCTLEQLLAGIKIDVKEAQGEDGGLSRTNCAGREVVASQALAANTSLVDIPRRMQIWNTDALADKFIQENLFTARHPTSRKLVDHRAYFAAYIGLKINSLQNETETGQSRQRNVKEFYLLYLPTASDYETHPVLEDLADLGKEFDPESSLAFSLTRWRQEEWKSEYEAFCVESEEFQAKISLTDYLVARINVSSRAFSAGNDWTVLTRSDASKAWGTTTKGDLEIYYNFIDYELKRDGIQVLVPFLDACNHHPGHNVDFDFDPDSLSFRVFITKDIEVGCELFSNYGGRIDQWLYATYGFVNADGSGLPGISLASFHTIQNEKLINLDDVIGSDSAEQSNTPRQIQKDALSMYLSLGERVGQWSSNVEDEESKEFLTSFNEWKLSVLFALANSPSHWILALPPKHPSAPLPHHSTSTYPTSSQTDEPQLAEDDDERVGSSQDLPVKDKLPRDLDRMMEAALPLCRLIALAPSDDIQSLTDKLPESAKMLTNPVLPEGGEYRSTNKSLEVRAHECLRDLVEHQLERVRTGRKIPSSENRCNESGDRRMKSLVRQGEHYALRLAKAYASSYLSGQSSPTL